MRESRMKFVNANQLHRKSGYTPDYLIMAKPPVHNNYELP
jgi:hypothetical protein